MKRLLSHLYADLVCSPDIPCQAAILKVSELRVIRAFAC